MPIHTHAYFIGRVRGLNALPIHQHNSMAESVDSMPNPYTHDTPSAESADVDAIPTHTHQAVASSRSPYAYSM